MDLTDCEYLTKTPDFNPVPKLERLILKGCKKLLAVHPSVEVLQGLILLNLEDCKCLVTLPHSINLRSLTTLILSGCSKLEKFPEIGENMKELSVLHLVGTAIKELPTSIKNLTGLSLLDLEDCKDLSSLPDIVCTLRSLRIINLSGCSNVDKLPQTLGSLENLEQLSVRNSAIRRAPSSIQLLKNLKALCFFGCGNPHINISSSTALQLPASFSGLCSLEKLDLRYCNLPQGAIPDDIGCLSSLKDLYLSGNNFVSVPESISQLSQLENLLLDNCRKLQSLPQLPLSIRCVYARNCPIQGTYSNKQTVRTSNASGFSFINCQPSNEACKLQRLPISERHLLRQHSQKFYEVLSHSLTHTHTH